MRRDRLLGRVVAEEGRSPWQLPSAKPFINVKASTKGFAKDLAAQLKTVLKDAQAQADGAFASIANSSKTAAKATTDAAGKAGKAQADAAQAAQKAQQAANKVALADYKRTYKEIQAAAREAAAIQAGFDRERSANAKAAAKAVADAEKALVSRLAAFGRQVVAAQKAADKERAASAKAAAKAQESANKAALASARAAAKEIAKAETEAYKIVAERAQAARKAQRDANAAALAAAKAAAKEIARAEAEAYKIVEQAARRAAAVQAAEARRAAAAYRAAAAEIAAANQAAANSAQSAGKKIVGVFDSIVNAAKFAAIGVLALGAAMTGIGLVQAGQIQLAQTAFSSLANEITNGEQKFQEFSDAARDSIGKEFVADLQNIALNSSLAFNTLAATSQSLLSLGFAGDEAKAVLLTAGDALAASGKAGGELNDNLRGIVVAFAQIKGSGRLLAQDLNQITTRIPSATRLKVYNNLARDLGLVAKGAKDASPEMLKARKEIIKLAEGGEIDADSAIASILKTLQEVPGAAGALERVNKTLPGQFEELKETIRLRLGQAFQPIAEELANRLGNLGTAISNKLVEVGPQLREFALNFADTLTSIVPKIIDVVAKSFEFLGKFLAVIGPFLPALIEGFGQLFEVAGRAIEALAPFLPIFSGFVQGILAVLTVLSPLLLAFELLGKLIGLIPTPILETFGVVLGAVAGAIVVVVGAMALAAKAAAVLRGAVLLLNAAFLLNPVGIAIAALVALGAIFVFAWKRSETFREIVVASLNLVVKIVGESVQFIVDFFLFFAESLVGLAAKAFGWIPGLGPKLSGAAQAVADFRDATNAAIDGIQKDIVITLKIKPPQVIGAVDGVTDPSDAGKALRAAGQQANNSIVDEQKKLTDDLIRRLQEAGNPEGVDTGGGPKAESAAVSAAKRRAQTFKEAIKAILSSLDAEFRSSLVTGSSKQIDKALDSLRNKIISTFRAARKTPPSGLIKEIDEQNEALKDLAKERDRVLKKLEAASQRASEVASSVRSFANSISEVTERIKQQVTDLSRLRIILPGQEAQAAGGLTPAQRTAKDFAQTLKDRLKAIQDFQKNINKLIKSGLNKETIDQILSAGVEGGGQLAAALSGASKATIKSINETQAKIEDAADALGQRAADSLFRSGKNVADGLIAGLEERRDEIKEAMKNIANDLVSEIKKQLKERSPSRVFRDRGRNAGKGLELGLLDQAGAVTAAGALLAKASVPSFSRISLPALQQMAAAESRLSPVTSTVGGARAASAAASAQVTNSRTINAPINQTFNVNQGVDALALADGIGRSIAGRLR